MLLITETVDYHDLDLICEKTEDGSLKSYKIKGPFLQAEQKNRNGRIYSKTIIEREVDNYQEKIKAKRSMGELDHPPVPSINLERVSHLIENLQMEGNNAVGSAKILNTPTGKIAQNLLDAGVKLGVSSRGVGSLDGSKVNEDYKMITVDIVCDPSAPDAFVDGIRECKEYIMGKNTYIETAVHQLEQDLSQHGSREILGDLQKFLTSIEF